MVLAMTEDAHTDAHSDPITFVEDIARRREETDSPLRLHHWR